jgi:hypothetical protein
MTTMTLFDYTMYIFDLVRDIGRQFRERQRTEFLAEKKSYWRSQLGLHKLGLLNGQADGLTPGTKIRDRNRMECAGSER